MSNREAKRPFWASNELLVIGGARSAWTWSIPDGELLRHIDLGARSTWQLGSEHVFARTLEVVSGRQVVHLRAWKLPYGEMQELGRVDRSSYGRGSIFLPDGTGWVYLKGPEIYLRPLPAQDGRRDRLLARHEAEVTHLGPRQKPPRFYASDLTGAIRVWDVLREGPEVTRVLPAPQGDPGWRTPDDSFRWAFRLEGQAQVWDLESWPQARPLTLRRSGSWDGAGVDFHPRSDWLVVSTRTYRHLTFWPLSGSFPIVVDGHGTGIRDRHRPVAFSPDGRWLATVWAADSIRLWPMPGSASREVKTLTLPLRNFWCELAFDPQARFLFVVGIADHAFIVPLDGSTPRRLERFSDDTLLVGAAVSPSGNRLVAGPTAGAGPRTLRVWDLESGELRLLELQEGSAGRKGIADIAFVDESTFYTAGWDGIRRWDLESGAHEIALPTRHGTAMGMALAPTGTTALVAETSVDSAGAFTMAAGRSSTSI